MCIYTTDCFWPHKCRAKFFVQHHKHYFSGLCYMPSIIHGAQNTDAKKGRHERNLYQRLGIQFSGGALA